MEANNLDAETIIKRFDAAKSKRSVWESHWQECYDYALPRRDGAVSEDADGGKKQQRLFDATAGDAVEQLAASLMSELTPAWSRWFNIIAGKCALDDEMLHEQNKDKLEKSAEILQYHFDRSNIIVELHQCFLDLATIGTACLLLEEAPLGHRSAFKFTAIPMIEVIFEEGINGRLDTTFRKSKLTKSQLQMRFPDAKLPDDIVNNDNGKNIIDDDYSVIEAVCPDNNGIYQYIAILCDHMGGDRNPIILANGKYNQSPFINFRWIKAPGEEYGRSPMMKVLPDVKTANKVVELILKNATIAVTGIWQADDDGVLNPATIKLVPGAIIPKAVGSSGLQPLKSPAEFNTSQLILEDLRKRIRHGLLADQFTPIESPRMSATEVIERSTMMSQQLAATYGRLQAELLLPLAERAISILKRRGEIANINLDGHMADIEIISPLAQKQRQRRATAVTNWLQATTAIGPQAAAMINAVEVTKWLANIYDIPAKLLNEIPEINIADDLMDDIDQLGLINEKTPTNILSNNAAAADFNTISSQINLLNSWKEI